MASAKAASLLGVLGSLVFLYAALARPSRDLVALGITALGVLFYWTQGFAVYLVRPDSLLLFAVGFGLFAATSRQHHHEDGCGTECGAQPHFNSSR